MIFRSSLLRETAFWHIHQAVIWMTMIWSTPPSTSWTTPSMFFRTRSPPQLSRGDPLGRSELSFWKKNGRALCEKKKPSLWRSSSIEIKKWSLWSWSLYKEWPLSCNVFHIALTIVSMSPRMWSNHWYDHWSVIISLIWPLIDRRDHHVILVLASCTIAPKTQTSISAKIAVINVIKSE